MAHFRAKFNGSEIEEVHVEVDLVEVLIEFIPSGEKCSISRIRLLLPTTSALQDGTFRDLFGLVYSPEELGSALTALIKGIKRGDKMYHGSLFLSKYHGVDNLDFMLELIE